MNECVCPKCGYCPHCGRSGLIFQGPGPYTADSFEQTDARHMTIGQAIFNHPQFPANPPMTAGVAMFGCN